MGKYFKASEYYPDDKDIYDFLDSQTRKTDQVLVFLRTRGIFCAKQTPKDHLQTYVSLLNFDWPSAVRLVDTIDLRETEDKLTNRKIEIDTNADQISDAIKKVQIERQNPNREVFKTKREGDAVVVSVSFVDVDTSKSRVLQKREKELDIRINPLKNEVNVTHTDSPRANEIVESVLQALMTANNAVELKETKIDLSHIRDHKLRLEFFVKMMREMPGMVLLDVSNVKVDRVPPSPSAQDTGENSEKSDEPIREKLKRVVLMGEQLLLTQEYHELTERGFFISSANWQSEKADGRGIRVEFHAGFSDSSDAKEFSYKVMGEYHRDDDGELLAQRRKVFGAERVAYQDALEKSAFSALRAVTGGKENVEPLP